MTRVRLLLVTILMATWALSTQAHAQDLKIRVGFGKTWGNSGVLLGRALGVYEKEGVKVTWLEFINPNQITQGIIAGAVDAGSSTGPHLVVAWEKGVKMKAVATLQLGSSPPTSFLVRTDSGINRIEDLRGKRIGINNFGGNFDIYLRYMLERHGMNPKKDVTILEVPIPAVFPSLLSKKIDAGSVPGALVMLAKIKFKGKIKPVFSYEDVAPNLNNMVLVMSDKFVDQRRKAAKAFLRGYLSAIKFAKENPKQALALWAKESGMGLVKAMPKFPELPDDGKVDLRGMSLDIKLLKHFGYTKTEPEIRQVVDHSLIDEILTQR